MAMKPMEVVVAVTETVTRDMEVVVEVMETATRDMEVATMVATDMARVGNMDFQRK